MKNHSAPKWIVEAHKCTLVAYYWYWIVISSCTDTCTAISDELSIEFLEFLTILPPLKNHSAPVN